MGKDQALLICCYVSALIAAPLVAVLHKMLTRICIELNTDQCFGQKQEKYSFNY